MWVNCWSDKITWDTDQEQSNWYNHWIRIRICALDWVLGKKILLLFFLFYFEELGANINLLSPPPPTQQASWVFSPCLPLLQVFYVDYGNSEWVPSSDVHDIQQEFLHLPLQAIECRLAGARPLEDNPEVGARPDEEARWARHLWT